LVDEDDNPLDLSEMSMVVGVYDKDGCEKLTGSTDDGKITYVDDGTFDWVFTDTEMRGLCKGTYSVGLTLSDGTNVTQIGTGSLPIIDGFVP
jgi:hypothetical protein